VNGVTTEFYTSPAGLSLTVDGRSNWPHLAFVWGAGSTHALQAPSPQTDAQGRIWQFSSWSNGGAQTQTFTVPNLNTTYTGTPGAGVKLTATYTSVGHLVVNSSLAGLTVSVNGSACAVPCDIQQPAGTRVDVSAPASLPMGSGSRMDFAGWSNGAGTGDLVLTLGSDPVTVSANYHLMNYLAASASPTGAAAFSLQPASPDGYYDSQTNVNVNAAAQPGFRFRSWTGDMTGNSPSGTIAMSAPRSVQAVCDRVPYIPSTGAQNGAGATPQAGVAPGSVVSIFGANLAADTAQGPTGQLSQTLGGTTVRIGSRLMPLFFVSPSQINLQLPADVPTGQQTVIVSAQGQPDVQTTISVVQDAPGLFQQTVNGQAFAVVSHQDGTPVTADSPARAGETLTLYGTGFGPTAPSRPEGFPVPASPLCAVSDPASVQVGDATLAVTSAFAVAGQVGVDAVQFVLGPGAPTSTTAMVTLTVNGQASNTLLLPIQ
jgi:uncharacterized protein (TIGR03437 family)